MRIDLVEALFVDVGVVVVGDVFLLVDGGLDVVVGVVVVDAVVVEVTDWVSKLSPSACKST